MNVLEKCKTVFVIMIQVALALAVGAFQVGMTTIFAVALMHGPFAVLMIDGVDCLVLVATTMFVATCYLYIMNPRKIWSDAENNFLQRAFIASK